MIDTRGLDDALVERFARSFFGFGSTAAPYWLVTAEPLDERRASAARIAAWKGLEEPLMADAPAFDRALETVLRRPAERFANQPTLPPLLRIVLDALGEPCAPFDVEEYLRTRAGREGDRLALLHLFPIPLRRAGRWDGHEICRLGAMRSRTAFLETFATGRLEGLSSLIGTSTPQLVVMVGNVFGNYWERLAGAPLAVAPDVPLRWRRVGATLYVQIAQPDVIGSLNATRSGAVAGFIRERLGGVPAGSGE